MGNFLFAYVSLLPFCLLNMFVMRGGESNGQGLVLVLFAFFGFMTASVVCVFNVSPGSSWFRLALDRYYSFAANLMGLLVVIGICAAGAAMLTILFEHLWKELERPAEDLVSFSLFALISHRLLLRLWPLLAMAYAAPESMGIRRWVLSLTYGFWRGPTIGDVWHLTGTFSAYRRFGLPVVMALQLCIFLFTLIDALPGGSVARQVIFWIFHFFALPSCVIAALVMTVTLLQQHRELRSHYELTKT